jgi:acyl dehydratase
MNNDVNSSNIGDLLAEYNTGPIGREALAKYAQASGDLNPLHLDKAFAQKAGFADVIVHGMLSMALMGRLLTKYAESGRLLSFGSRFGGVVPVDDSLHCRMRLKAKAEDHFLVDLDATTSSGNTAISGEARIAISG